MYTKKVLQFHCDVEDDARSEYCGARGRTWYKVVEVVWEEGAPDRTEQEIGGSLMCDWCHLNIHSDCLEDRQHDVRDQQDGTRRSPIQYPEGSRN